MKRIILRSKSFGSQVVLFLFSLLLVGTSSNIAADYATELEEAFVAKIQESKGEISSPLLKKEKLSIKDLGLGTGRAIGKEVVTFIKTSLKNPILDFLASSELTEWPIFKQRYDQVIRVLNLFGTKYRAEMTKLAVTPTPPVYPQTLQLVNPMMPKPLAKRQPIPRPVMPTGMMPITKKTIKKTKLVSMTPLKMPVVKSGDDEDEDDDDEDDEEGDDDDDDEDNEGDDKTKNKGIRGLIPPKIATAMPTLPTAPKMPTAATPMMPTATGMPTAPAAAKPPTAMPMAM